MTNDDSETRRPIPVLDLFAGVGGFTLAFESIMADTSCVRCDRQIISDREDGHGLSITPQRSSARDEVVGRSERHAFRTIGFSEIDEYASAVLEREWPHIPNLGDIRLITRDSVIERCGVLPTVITGGFPCQPHSTAGKRGASSDERDLWDECARMLRELRPLVAVFENVRGLLSSESGHFLNRVLSDLAELRYACQWQVVSAEDIGAPHKRDRIWLVCVDEMAYSEGDGSGVGSELRVEDGGSRRALPSESDVASESELADSSGNGRSRSRRQERRELQSSSGCESDGCSGVQRIVGEEELADSTARGRRERRQSSRSSRLAHGRDEIMANSDSSGPGEYSRSESIESELAAAQHNRHAWPSLAGEWPSRPGEPQHWWEPPRTTGVVGNTDRRRCEQRDSGERRLPESDETGGEAVSVLGRVPDGLPDRSHSAAAQIQESEEEVTDLVNRVPRLKALGNSIVPGVAAIFAHAIYRVINERE